MLNGENQIKNRSLTLLEKVSSVLDLCLDNDYLLEKDYKSFDVELKNLLKEFLRFERSLRKTKNKEN